MLPPAIADEAENSQGSKSQINDPLVQGLGRPFSQLLGRPRAYGALRFHTEGTGRQQKEQNDKHPFAPHHNCLLIR